MENNISQIIGYYQAVLFDFDGVIPHTMDDNFNAWRYALKKENITIIKDVYFKMGGRTVHEGIDYFAKMDNVDITPAVKVNIVRDKEKYYLDNNKFRIYDGIEKLKNELKNKKILLGLSKWCKHKAN